MFSVVLPRPAAELLKEAKAAAAANGLSFEGNEQRGSFSSVSPRVKGTYSVKDGVLTVQMTEKPWFVPEALIEVQLRALLK